MVLKNLEKEKRPFKEGRKPAKNGLKSIHKALENSPGIEWE